MKLSTREAASYFAKPDPDKAGLLIYGPDAMRIALKRQEVIAALIGPSGEEEMRLTRMQGAALRKDPAAVMDAMRAASFFPGARVAFIEEANDAAAPAILAALAEWQPGDAQLIVTAAQLKASSKLRKGFETHKNAYAVAIYDDPPSRAEIEAELKRAGLPAPDRSAMDHLSELARSLDPGEFRQTMEKLSLYKYGDASPATVAEIDACAPGSTDANMDDILAIVAQSRAPEIGPMIARLTAQGVSPVALMFAFQRHFRSLYAIAAHPGGPGQGIGSLRPPVFGPRRDLMMRQAQSWGAAKSAQALEQLVETDLRLRSAGATAPAMALVERVLIRLAMMNRR